jgi:hypothetical protein
VPAIEIAATAAKPTFVGYALAREGGLRRDHLTIFDILVK